jgi:hypothetical protein
MPPSKIPKTYKEVERMVRGEVLQTHLARRIVAKAGIRVALSGSGGGGTTGPLASFINLIIGSTPGGLIADYAGVFDVIKQIKMFRHTGSEAAVPNDITTNAAPASHFTYWSTNIPGYYRIIGKTLTINFHPDAYDFPQYLRLEAVARDASDVKIRHVLLAEYMFTSEPQGPVTQFPPTWFPPHTDTYFAGMNVMRVEAGERIYLEFTTGFLTNVPSDVYADGYQVEPASNTHVIWGEYLGPLNA